MNLRTAYRILRQMGPRYVRFRLLHEWKRRTGGLQARHPVDPPRREFIKLSTWRREARPFFFASKEELQVPKQRHESLRQRVEAFDTGRLTYFSGEELDIGTDYDWLCHPLTGFRYDPRQHWSEINELSNETGDIKYVWEKSRFSFLYDLIRYDYHFGEDQSEKVWREMESWMDANPINCGPNFICSQEISLRCLNWTFAIYYYRHSDVLTQERFARLMDYIYWQLRHVAENIQFSLVSVRNNHALTEVSTLYMAGLLFPFFPEAKEWWQKGREWVEQEVLYQIYEDGSYLQYSHNYHRVVIQILTWVLFLSEKYDDRLSERVHERIRKSLEFLYAHQVDENGWLPNYGANDGALFFPLSNCHYRDYRPQLNALHYYFSGTHLYPEGPWREDAFWFSGSVRTEQTAAQAISRNGTYAFDTGGFYVLRKQHSLTALRCGRHQNRPVQADNLHLDLWCRGENVLRDAGVFRYNTDPFWFHWFNGTHAHNTVSLNGYDQMEKGPRFIWFHWSQADFGHWEEKTDRWIFKGRVRICGQLGKYITHQRRVEVLKETDRWLISDEVRHPTGMPIRQHWHPGPAWASLGFQIRATDGAGAVLSPVAADGWYAETYGVKEPAPGFYYETSDRRIHTEISLPT